MRNLHPIFSFFLFLFFFNLLVEWNVHGVFISWVSCGCAIQEGKKKRRKKRRWNHRGVFLLFVL